MIHELLTSDSVSVVETFNNFWAEIVQWIGNVEAMRIVKRFVGRAQAGGVPAERLGPDSSESGVVQIMAAIDECKPEVDVVLPAKD